MLTKATHLILVNRARGRYRVSSLDPANPITSLRAAGPERPFTSRARVDGARGGRRVLRMRYLKPAGARLKIIERGRGAQRTIVRKAKARRFRDGSKRLCLTKRFRPADGPGGRRTLEVVLERDGIPLDGARLTSYQPPSMRRPRNATGTAPASRIQRS